MLVALAAGLSGADVCAARAWAGEIPVSPQWNRVVGRIETLFDCRLSSMRPD